MKPARKTRLANFDLSRWLCQTRVVPRAIGAARKLDQFGTCAITVETTNRFGPTTRGSGDVLGSAGPRIRPQHAPIGVPRDSPPLYG